MPKFHPAGALLLVLMALPAAPTAAADKPAGANSLDDAGSLPLGYPAFDRIQVADFEPAFSAAMAEHDAEVAAIAGAKDAPTFDNTVLAFERAGRRLHRLGHLYTNLLASRGDPQLQQLDEQLAPRLSRHSDGIYLDEALFRRVDAVYRSPEKATLDPESRQLLERTYADFVRQGARLPAADRAQLVQVNARLASLTSTFRRNVLAASAGDAVRVTDRARLDGLGEERISAAAAAARARGLQEGWLLALGNTTDQEVLASLTDRALRERIYRASIGRAHGGRHDNRPVVAAILQARARKAALLRYRSFAELALADEGAATPAAANALLDRIAAASLAATRRDAVDLQALMDAERRAAGLAPAALQPWDWAYYSDRLRRQRLGFDQAQVRGYFELDRVLRDGVFFAAHELFGLQFRERHDLPVYAPGVRVFDVLDEHGAQLAIFIADYFAREGKQGGAWMDNYVDQSRLFGERPVVVNNLNLPQPGEGQPALLSFDEVVGMFHEFGHALHGMLSDVQYESLSGTIVPRDFVEFPSQCFEMWARDPRVVAHFAFDHRSGAPMPPDLLAQVIKGQQFNAGFRTSEYVVAAILDMELHGSPRARGLGAAGLDAFERDALARRHALYALAPPRYHPTYFLHAFSDEEYAAGYYAYLWSEVLARDVGQWINAHGGLGREAGDAYRAKVLARGRTAEPAELFRSLYGRDPEVGPLLEYRGLAAPGVSPP